jgi:tetratricopeptide (TPR) repeat protein
VIRNTFGLAFVVLASTAVAEDTITLAPRTDDPGRIVLKGKIVDYTGAQLTFVNSAGNQQTVPGKQVVEIQSTWTADHIAGDDLWQRQDFAAAATKYQAALAAEPRRWARRLILSRFVATLRELGRWDAATEQFFALIRDDPTTPYFAVIPLAWTTIDASPTLETKAKAWVNERSSNLAGLLGGSFLLSTTSREDGLRRLRELTGDPDPRIAIFAEALQWRTAAVTADAAKLNGWERSLDKLPEPLRPGPYLALGRAWNLKNESERAALVLMRLPILYADEQPRLAAEALWSAGQALEQLQRPTQAARIYHELIRDYSQAVVAAPATDRLKELSTAKP